jgi:hypothetical protein
LDNIGVKVGEGGIGGIHVDVGRLKAVGRSWLEFFFLKKNKNRGKTDAF